MLLAPRADFDYGNVRLRARSGRLLARVDYDALLDQDLDGLLSALGDGPYTAEVEGALGRDTGLAAVRAAVRAHHARALEEARGFYSGVAGELVGALLARFDLHNLLTLVRGRALGGEAADTLAATVPIGALDESAAGEVARQAEPARAVELMIAWRVPDPRSARALARAWPAYVRTEDLAELERALVAAHFARMAAELERFGSAADPLREELAAEADTRNALVVLRLVDVEGGSPDAPRATMVPGGRLGLERLAEEAAAAADAGALADALAEAGPAGPWARALGDWQPREGVAALETALERSRLRRALDRLRSGDPLGVDVPIGYVTAKTVEARNLRLLAEAAAYGADPAEVRDWLLMPRRGEAA